MPVFHAFSHSLGWFHSLAPQRERRLWACHRALPGRPEAAADELDSGVESAMRAYVPASWLARALHLQDKPNSGHFLRDSTELELLVKATPDESNVVLLRE